MARLKLINGMVDTLFVLLRPPRRAFIWAFMMSSMAWNCDSADTPPSPQLPEINNTVYNWRTYYLGSGISSSLFSVVISNDSLAFAVGEVYQNDSTGTPDQSPYGLAIYDGVEWGLQKVAYRRFGSNTLYPGKLTAVVYDSNFGLYVASSACVLVQRDSSWQEMAFLMVDLDFQGQLATMCRLGNNGLLCAGSSGKAYLVTAEGWREVESGTNTRINDLFPVSLAASDFAFAIGAVSDLFRGGDSRLLRFNIGLTVDSLNWSAHFLVQSAWSPDGQEIYAVGDGISVLVNGIWEDIEIDGRSFLNTIRGSSKNNIFVAGDNGFVARYNGERWKNIEGTQSSTNWFNLSVTDRLVIAVGSNGEQAVALVGRAEP